MACGHPADVRPARQRRPGGGALFLQQRAGGENQAAPRGAAPARDGEREAIQSIREQRASPLVTDDSNAYKAALAQGIPVTRTLRILEMAAERGLLDLPTLMTRLQAAGFYTPADVVEDMLARNAERKRQQSSTHGQ